MKTLNETLEEIEKRADAATEGPWLAGPHYGVYSKLHINQMPGTKSFSYSDVIASVRPYGVDDQSFIAHARTDVPKLLAMLRLAIEQRDTAYTCSWDKDLGSMIADDDLALLAVGRGE